MTYQTATLDYIKWLRGMAKRGGKGTVDRIDARAFGRIANRLKELHSKAAIDATV